MKEFEKYLEKLREDVKRAPKDELERGFQVEVVLIHERYKRLNLQEKVMDTAYKILHPEK